MTLRTPHNYTYQAFGALEEATGETANQYLFAGEQFEAETSEYYLRDRYYDYATGRFTRRDSANGRLIAPPTLQRYVYAANSPVNLIDPSGLFYTGEIAAANSIRMIWSGMQLSGVGYFQSASESGGRYGVKDFLKDFSDEAGTAAFAMLFPVMSTLLDVHSVSGLSGGGGSGSGGGSGGGGGSYVQNTRILSSGEPTSEFVFHGSSRSPEDVFANGINANNPNGAINQATLEMHVDSARSSNSPYIGTSKSARVALKEFTMQGEWVYIVRVPETAIDVESRGLYGSRAHLAYEREVAIPRRIDPSWIIAAKPVGGMSSLDGSPTFKGRIRRNPRFGG
jgi:RHS repeat-associated protein